MFESTIALQPGKDFYPCNRTLFSRTIEMECGYGRQWAKLFWNKKGDWEINRNCNENRVIEDLWKYDLPAFAGGFRKVTSQTVIPLKNAFGI